jgi:acetyl esterase/lipase
MDTSTGIGNVHVVVQADLEYAKVGGMSLRLDLYTPSGAPPRLPTLLHLHGGACADRERCAARGRCRRPRRRL